MMSPKLLAEKICLVIEAILNFSSTGLDPAARPDEWKYLHTKGFPKDESSDEQVIFVNVSGLANKIMSLPVVAHVL